MGRRLEAFKAVIADWTAGDIDAVLARMTDDIEWHIAAAAEPPLHGKAKARKFLERFKADIAEVRWRLFHSAETEDRLFVEGVDEYVSAAGRLVAAPYAGVIEFRGDLICGWRDYVDIGVIAAQKAGGEASGHVRELVSRPAI